MAESYRTTTWACYLSYVVQSVVNTLPPLLFVTFQHLYGLTVAQLGLLVVLNFGSQVVIDLLSAPIADHFGYRTTMVFGHLCALAGLVLMAILPQVIGFLGIVLAMIPNALGGGIVEVLVSPIVEAIPDEKAKSGALTMLFGFYSWGTVLTVLGTTALYHYLGIARWYWISLCWIFLPLLCIALFFHCPIAPLIKEGEQGMTGMELARKPVFLVLFAMMGIASCAEFGISQWASYFAETGLGVSKTMGDVLGPCLFFLLMGLVRMTLGRRGDIPVRKAIILGSLCCFVGYLLTVFSPYPMVSLLGCAACGAATALFWPGTFSLAGELLPLGGTTMYSLMAFSGDLGCAIGPEFISLFSWGGDIRHGLLLASLFPLVMALLCALLPLAAGNTGSRDTL